MRRPDLPDLERGIHGFQSSSAATADDAAARYEQRIARNLEEIVRREQQSGSAWRESAQARLAALLGREGSLDELEVELCRRLADGAIDESSPPLMLHLRELAIARVEIDSPRYWSLQAAKARVGR